MQVQKRRSQQERSDISDQCMLDAAVALILEKGTEKTTLKEVGEKAGYSRGLAGYRFGSKLGLFSFVIKTLGDYWLQDMIAATTGKTGLDAILAATERHYRAFEKNPDNVRAFYTLWFDVIGADDELKKVVQGINLRRQQDLQDWIESDPRLEQYHHRAEAIAAQINVSINGITYQWLLNPADLSVVKSLHQDLNAMLRQILSVG